MAYSVAKIIYATAWLVASELADDGTVDLEQLTCMTNGTTAEDCDELKIGTTCLKIGIDQPPADITALKIRFYLNSIMAAGDNAVTPYTDANSVSGTNKNNQTYDTAGAWVEHILSAALIAELADINGQCFLRLNASDGLAKSKLGEVQIDMTYNTYKVEGITKDNSGVALGSCQCSLFKDEGSGVYTYISTQTSNATTGAYSFTGLGSGSYMVTAHKADSPNVFDVTDSITAIIE